MATIRVFTVYDSKAEAFMQPWFQQNRGSAIRIFGDLVNKPDTIFYNHPEDFTLFELGEFDEQLGKFTNLTAPVSLGLAVEFRKISERFSETLSLGSSKLNSTSEVRAQ